MSRAPAGLRADVPLADLTTLGIGGPAAHFVSAASEDDVRRALAWARDEGLEVLVVGGGSNLLVADRGFSGLTLSVDMKGIERNGGRLVVGAGHEWDELVAYAVREDLAGLECLSGIPGRVGATPIQNVGAYGQEVGETIAEVRVLDRATSDVLTMSASECAFGYRDSVFKRALRGQRVVLAVTFDLAQGGRPAVRYPELEKELAKRGLTAPSLADVRETIIALRRAKSMVLDPRDENARSAGSFFMNPIVDAPTAAEALTRARARGALREGETMPAFPALDGKTKLSAAWLIERAGFTRGTARGRVGISTKHSLALVNRGGATASELVALAREVRDGVLAAFGVRIVPEPELVGFTHDELGDLLH